MASSSAEMVGKLWSLCNTLRDDGISYHDYVGELTSLLFIKMLQETKQEIRIPESYRWNVLSSLTGKAQLDRYRETLMRLGDVEDDTVRAIFRDAQTKIRRPANLSIVVKALDDMSWFDGSEELLGDVYEGILERNASDKKSGAGQYFTPRPLIDSMVRVMQPSLAEVVQDPAAGTGGFLVSAHRFAKQSEKLKRRRRISTGGVNGTEIVPETYRLAMMNLALHGIEGTLTLGDTLGSESDQLPSADVVLSNPPFGTKRGGVRPDRAGFEITMDSSNKQLAFVEHIVRSLKDAGRAAIVLPDNVLFEEGVGRRLRTWLMDSCDLHTILRLPTGIFYAQGVKTNVVFFAKRAPHSGATKGVWIYDMRAQNQVYTRNRLLSEDAFSDFEAMFGDDPFGKALRHDQGLGGRFRYFSRELIAGRGDNLDISWLSDAEYDPEKVLTEPDELAAAVLEHLRSAVLQLEAVIDEPGFGGPRA